MNKDYYQNKMQQMINGRICDGTCKVTEDIRLDDLKPFRSFLYRNFYWKYEHYEKSNKPGQLYGTAKTHKFSVEEITLENQQFRPIIAIQ